MPARETGASLRYSSTHTYLNSRKDITEMKPEKASKKTRLPRAGAGSYREAVVDAMAIQRTGRSTGKEMMVKSDPLPPAFATMAARIVVTAAMDAAPAACIRSPHGLDNAEPMDTGQRESCGQVLPRGSGKRVMRAS